MSRPVIQIFTAIEMERRAIGRALTLTFFDPAQCPVEWRLAVVGVRATRLPAKMPPDTSAVLLAGLAGGLDPELRIGDLVLDCSDLAGPPDAEVHRTTTCRRGRIATASDPVTTPAAKADLYRFTGAHAVDMEGAMVVSLARAAGLPFLHLRAISDTAADAIDPRILSLVDDVGRPRPWRLTAYLLHSPRRIAELVHLGRASRLATVQLGKEVARLLPALASLMSQDHTRVAPGDDSTTSDQTTP